MPGAASNTRMNNARSTAVLDGSSLSCDTRKYRCRTAGSHRTSMASSATASWSHQNGTGAVLPAPSAGGGPAVTDAALSPLTLDMAYAPPVPGATNKRRSGDGGAAPWHRSQAPRCCGARAHTQRMHRVCVVRLCRDRHTHSHTHNRDNCDMARVHARSKQQLQQPKPSRFGRVSTLQKWINKWLIVAFRGWHTRCDTEQLQTHRK